MLQKLSRGASRCFLGRVVLPALLFLKTTYLLMDPVFFSSAGVDAVNVSRTLLIDEIADNLGHLCARGEEHS